MKQPREKVVTTIKKMVYRRHQNKYGHMYRCGSNNTLLTSNVYQNHDIIFKHLPWKMKMMIIQ
jgi:hypothetical protein